LRTDNALDLLECTGLDVPLRQLDLPWAMGYLGHYVVHYAWMSVSVRLPTS